MKEVNNSETNRLFLIVLGASGSGKSRVAGTAPGKTLFLSFQGERHGPISAAQSGGDILPVFLDKDNQGNVITADEAYKKGLQFLDPEALKENNIDSVVFDGFTEFEKVIRKTKLWKQACLSKDGKHNNFQEPSATLDMMDNYISAFRLAQDRANVNIITTGVLDIQELEDNGEISVAKPRLSGYSVAEGVIQQFSEILPIGKITKPDGSSGFCFQTGSDIQKVSTDSKGRVKKFVNFNPRISSHKKKLPAFIKADLKEVLKFVENSV